MGASAAMHAAIPLVQSGVDRSEESSETLTRHGPMHAVAPLTQGKVEGTDEISEALSRRAMSILTLKPSVSMLSTAGDAQSLSRVNVKSTGIEGSPSKGAKDAKIRWEAVRDLNDLGVSKLHLPVQHVKTVVPSRGNTGLDSQGGALLPYRRRLDNGAAVLQSRNWSKVMRLQEHSWMRVRERAMVAPLGFRQRVPSDWTIGS